VSLRDASSGLHIHETFESGGRQDRDNAKDKRLHFDQNSAWSVSKIRGEPPDWKRPKMATSVGSRAAGGLEEAL
jgi:hypothetical protein